jgi:putative PIN family toxin of toxin-antitoxin system
VFLAKAERVTITKSIRCCRDPKDDKFLELAVNRHADILITGDKDLLTLGTFENIPILKPSDFLYAFAR